MKRPDPVAEPVPTPAQAHETPRHLQLLADTDTDLNIADFRADPRTTTPPPGVLAHVATPPGFLARVVAPAIAEDSANERSGNEESGTGGEDEGFADDEIEAKNTIEWDEEKGLVNFNNRHSGSFVSVSFVVFILFYFRFVFVLVFGFVFAFFFIFVFVLGFILVVFVIVFIIVFEFHFSQYFEYFVQF